MSFCFENRRRKKVISEQRKVREEDRIKSVRERQKRWKQRERKKERKQELLFSRERARANRSGETLRTACCIFRAAQRRAVAFQSTRALRFRSGRFGNITELIYGTSSCNHLEKERDACSVPTQPLAVTMPVETNDNDVAAGVFFFWFCAARSRAPCVYFQRKGRKPHFLRRFPSLLTSKGSMCFRRNERQQKCPSAPSNATVGRRRRRHCFFLPLCFLSGVPVPTS